MNRTLILAAIENAQWAIKPEALATIISVATEGQCNLEGYNKTGEGAYEGLQALQDRQGVSTKNGKAQVFDVVAEDGSRQKIGFMEFSGPFFRRANMITDFSGATSLENQVREFNALLADKSIGAIIHDFDTPGGEVNGTREMANLIAKGRAVKPIIGYASYQAASAGYWTASASTELYLDPTASLGSIGVVSTSRKPDEEGVFQFVSSQSPMKRADPASKEGAAERQKEVDQLAAVFVGEVAAYRGVSEEKVLKDFGRGGTLVGQAAVDAGMADGVMSFDEVLQRAAFLAKDFKSKSALGNSGSKKVTATNKSTNMNQELEGEVALAALQEQNAALAGELAAIKAEAAKAAKASAELAAALKESRVEARNKENKAIVEAAVAKGTINAGSANLISEILGAAADLDEIFASTGKEQISLSVDGIACVGVSQMILAVLDARDKASATGEGEIGADGVLKREVAQDEDFDTDLLVKQANEARERKVK